MMLSFREACRAIVRNAETPALNYAVGYARAGLDLTDGDACRVQALYILNNMSRWRGPEAKEVRAALKHVGGVK